MPESSPKTSKEILSSIKVIDFSGYNDPSQSRYNPTFLDKQIRPFASLADKIVVLPDLGPTQPGIVPTGSAMEINTNNHPDWLRVVKGADIGCGMLVASLDVDSNHIENDKKLLGKIYTDLSNSPGDLGGGNHFIDLVKDPIGNTSVVIHTGSPGEMQKKLIGLVDDPDKWFAMYEKVVKKAQENRLAILDSIVTTLGVDPKIIHESIHNTVVVNRGGIATIYKGSVKIVDPTRWQLLPSSVGEEMILYKPGSGINGSELFAAPHGTGRKLSRSEAKSLLTDTVHQPKIMLPSQLSGVPVTELPEAYHSLGDTWDIMQKNNLIEEGDKNTIFLKPFAYLGHLH